MVVRHHGRIVADIPAKKLADEAPVYEPESLEPAYLEGRARLHPGRSGRYRQTLRGDLKALLAWPTIASKNWVYRQYDQMVRNGGVVCPGSDAAVLRIKEDSLPGADGRPSAAGAVPEKLIALTVDGNGAYVCAGPVRRRQAGRGRGGAKPGLHRRRPAGHH